jgi:hypothetical protein
MAHLPLTPRLEILEEKVTALGELPARVAALEAQFLEFRAEVRAEFSALRVLIPGGEGETCRVLRDEIRAGDEETRRVLRDEIRAGDEETRRLMRVLHEDVIARIELMDERWNGRRTDRRRPRKSH